MEVEKVWKWAGISATGEWLLHTISGEVCGRSKGGKDDKKETWWWNNKVQYKIKTKRDAFKEWQTSGDAQKKESYNKEEKRGQKVVVRAKSKVGIQFYDNLETNEG